MSCLHDVSLILKDLKRHILEKKDLRNQFEVFHSQMKKNTLLVMCILVIDLLFF
jgi:hypothetical protein